MIVGMNDSTQRYTMEIDTTAKRMKLMVGDAEHGAITYERHDSIGLIVSGTLAGDTIQATLRRVDQNYPLLQPFHLVKPRRPMAWRTDG